MISAKYSLYGSSLPLSRSMASVEPEILKGLPKDGGSNPQEEDGTFEFTEFKGELPNMRKIEALTLEYRNVTLKVPIKKGGQKVVLDDVKGIAAAGTFTAIMGPSGGGKTTLLNVLAGRVTNIKKAELTGQLLVKDKPRNESDFKSQAAYVMQDDILFAFMTVRETLMMACHFHLGFSLSVAQKQEYVTNIISVLGLTKAQNTIIGSAKVRGVSGGERKRVNIGVELIADPAILFMDEPTTGLDSFQALSVMSAIKNLTRNGRTVVASIHQPRSSIFALFDMLHLLSEGRTVFFGPAPQALNYFASQGFSCPPSFNSADYFLDIISLDLRAPELESASRERLSRLHTAWRSRRTEMIRRVSSTIPEPNPLTPRTVAAREPWTEPRPHKYRISWITQFGLLLWRQLSLVWRDKFGMGIRVFMAVMFSLVLGAIYSERNTNQKSIQDSIGLLFGCILNQTFGAMVGILNTFGEEKHIVQRERASKSYRLSAYFVSKVLSEIPLNMLAGSVFSIVLYWISNLSHTPGQFFIFWAVILLNTFCGMGLGLLLATMAPDAETANALAPLFNVSMMLLSGFYINVSSLPAGAKWTPYASFMRWNFASLVINEFRGKTYDCPALGGCIRTGETVIANLSFDGFEIAEAVGYTWIIAAVLYFLAYVFLRLASPRYMSIMPPTPATIAASPVNAPKEEPEGPGEAQA